MFNKLKNKFTKNKHAEGAKHAEGDEHGVFTGADAFVNTAMPATIAGTENIPPHSNNTQNSPELGIG